jgi:hypothetical protein
MVTQVGEQQTQQSKGKRWLKKLKKPQTIFFLVRIALIIFEIVKKFLPD